MSAPTHSQNNITRFPAIRKTNFSLSHISFSPPSWITRRFLLAAALSLVGHLIIIGFVIFQSHASEIKTAEYARQKSGLIQQIAQSSELHKPPTASAGFSFSVTQDLDGILAFLHIQAQKSQVAINKFSIQLQPSSTTQWGTTQISLNTSSEYTAIKSILQDLLDRYSFLAVRSVAMQPTQSAHNQIETQLELDLYRKD